MVRQQSLDYSACLGGNPSLALGLTELGSVSLPVSDHPSTDRGFWVRIAGLPRSLEMTSLRDSVNHRL